MQTSKNKKAMTIGMLMIATIALTLITLPTANAQSTRATYPYIGATPNPVNVGGETLLHVGITAALPLAQIGWTGLTITVTRPDGTTETLGPFRTDSTGGTGTVYVPTLVGNYTLQTHFPEQIYNNVTYKASDSAKLTLIVQEEPIAYYPGVPLPTEYWTRPIDSQAREWYTIAGSWLTAPANLFAPYNDGPESAHILWTKVLTLGGMVGGELGLVGSGPTSVGMETGDAYEGKFATRLIVAGKLYYTEGAYNRPNLIHCVDLRTGEELWAKTFLNNLTIAMGQLMYWESYNYQGTFAYLWVTSGTTWQGFDALSGNWMCNITDVPSGTNIVGARGEIYRYTVSLTGGYMQMWNQSALVAISGSWGSAIQLQNLNASATVNASTTVLTARAQRAWTNITIPKGLPGSVRAVKLGDKVVGMSINSTDVVTWAFSLKKGQEGTLLYNTDWKAPAAWAAGNLTIAFMTSSFEDNVAVLFSTETLQNYGFSLETGNYLWGPTTPPQYYLDALDDSKAGVRCIAYGKLYSASVGGIVYCYDVKTGALLWTYAADDPYTEILWSNNWWLKPVFITDGKIYLGSTEHSANQPLPRGAPFICLNATTGEVIWRVNGLFRQTRWGGRAIIGDSIIATMDTYDQRVYAIGKGPSATTVTAPGIGVTAGNSLVITGTVTDVSPGTKQTELTLRFPNGVPAVSDASMSDWMLYVYKQFPRPTNATGVEVTLDAIDPNGNSVHLGTATSDASGTFGFDWVTPDIPGKYTIIATFAGSGAYYASYAETYAVVTEAPQEPLPPVEQPPSMTDTYVLYGVASIIVAIAIVGALLALLLFRKRP